MTKRQPLFTEQDRAELLALALYRDGLCPLCGRELSVCTSMEGKGPGFTADWIACRATLAKLEFQRAKFGDLKKPDPNAPAYLYPVKTLRG